MGYEVKIIVGRLGEKLANERSVYLSELARMDLCKPGYDSAIYALCGRDASKPDQGEPAYIYNDTGNTKIIKDRYGDKLRALPIDDVIAALESDSKHDSYERFKIALDMLRAWRAYYISRQLHVILYGH